MLSVILMLKKLLEHFMKKKMQKTSQEEFRIEKVINKKGDKLYVKWKGQIIHLIIGFIKKML